MAEPEEMNGYTVGYGRPPPQFQFKKGRSGNPKGRPRKAAKKAASPRFEDASLDKLLEQEAFRLLQLNENGKPVEMSAAQAILRSLLVDGVKGNRLAKKYAFEMLRKEEHETLKRSLDRFDHFAKKKAEGNAKIAECEKRGVEPPRLYPHPDDILLDIAKLEVHLLGPMSEDRAIPYERGVLVRDLFHAFSVLEEKLGQITTIECDGISGAASGAYAMMIDDSLPPSFQRGEGSTCGFLMELADLSKRQLRLRIKDLMARIASMPPTIEERLAARERAINAVGVLGDAFEKAAAEMAERHNHSGPS